MTWQAGNNEDQAALTDISALQVERESNAGWLFMLLVVADKTVSHSCCTVLPTAGVNCHWNVQS